MFYLPLIGSVALAAGTVLERFVLKVKKIDVNLYQVTSFLAIILSLLPFLYFFWKVDSAALEPKNIALFSIVVLFSIIANLLVFYSLKGEKVVNLEPARALEPMFVILFALVFSFFFDGDYERNWKIIIPALIASISLMASHVERHHLRFNKYFILAILGSIFFALELVVSRKILDFYSPIAFYFLRCLFIFLISLIALRPNFSKLDKKNGFYILITGVIWSVYRVFEYYGYLTIGIVFTTLILMLGPVFIYIFAHIFLKEKMSWKNFVTSIVIVASILYVVLSG